MRRTKIPKKRPPGAANRPPAAAHVPPVATKGPSSASWRFWILLSALFILAAAWGFRTYYRANEIGYLRQASRTAERGGNWQELETLSERWISIEPKNDDAWMHFASAKRHLEDWDGFVNAVEQLSPDNPFYLASLEAAVDVLIDESKDIRHAEQLLLRILAAEPNRQQAYQRLIFLYSMTLQKAKLHSMLRASLRQGSEPPEAYVYLLTLSSLNFSNGLFRTSQWRSGTQDYEPLEVAYAIYLARAKETKANQTLRMLDRSTRQYGSTAFVEVLAKRYPSNVELLSFLIERAMDAGEVNAVGEYLSRWDPAAQSDYRYLRYRGWFEDMSNDMTSSLQSYSEALSFNPLDWRTRNELATIQRSLGQAEAEANAELAATGKKLEREFLELPSADKISPVQLQKLRDYALQCGDLMVAERLTQRAATLGKAEPAPKHRASVIDKLSG